MITDFDRAWPDVAARLQRLLAARGVAPEAADDICQEVAWRVVARRVEFDSADDLYPWAATVARRLSIDLHRTQRHLVPVEPPERADDVDIPSLVEARARLRAVAEAMPQLSEHDRAALTAIGGTPVGSRKEAVRLAVRRHRARARLLAMVEAAGAVVAWVVGRIAARRMAKPSLALAGAVAPAMLLAWSFGPMTSDGPVDAAPREARPAAVAVPRAVDADADAKADKPSLVDAPPARRSAPETPAPVSGQRAVRPLLAAEPTVPGGQRVGRAAVRPRTASDADACVTVGGVTTLCADVTDSLLAELGR